MHSVDSACVLRTRVIVFTGNNGITKAICYRFMSSLLSKEEKNHEINIHKNIYTKWYLKRKK